MAFSSTLAAISPHSTRQRHYGFGITLAVVLGLVLAAAIATALWQAPRPGWHGHMLHLSANMEQVDQQVYVTVAEIQRVRSLRGSCNLLVFGVGFDSVFWANVNVGGHTVFLEYNSDWARYVHHQAPDLSIYTVNLQTQLDHNDDRYLSMDTWKNLTLRVYGINASIDVLSTSWDVIIIDGPAKEYSTGRITALYSGVELVRPAHALTVVDDCERPLVRKYADLFYSPEALFLAVPRPPRFVPSLYNPVYGGNLQCFYRHKR